MLLLHIRCSLLMHRLQIKILSSHATIGKVSVCQLMLFRSSELEQSPHYLEREREGIGNILCLYSYGDATLKIGWDPWNTEI